MEELKKNELSGEKREEAQGTSVSRLESITKSKNFKTSVRITVAALILILVFSAGVLIGLEKAGFSYRMSEDYFSHFGPPRPFPFDTNFGNPHGPAGQIIKIEGSTLLIKNPDGTENSITTDSNTAVRKGRNDIKVGDLKVNDNIIVVGSPNSLGQIQANLIRVLN
jgi:hypothetical protein